MLRSTGPATGAREPAVPWITLQCLQGITGIIAGFSRNPQFQLGNEAFLLPSAEALDFAISVQPTFNGAHDHVTSGNVASLVNTDQTDCPRGQQ